MSFAHMLVHSLNEPAFLIEHDGRCTSNDAAIGLIGASPENVEALHHALEGGLSTQDRDALVAAVSAAASGREQSFEMTWAPARERPCPLEAALGPAGERGDDVLVVLRRVAPCDRERASRERLERLAAVGQLTTGVTHELNNVLTAIIGWTQLAMRAPDRPEAVESALSIIDENSRRAKAIIDDVLNVARGEHGPEGRVSLAEISDEVLRVLSWELTNHDVKVDRRYLDTTPLGVDRRKLFQVLLNVVLNAIQAMPNGGTLTVETSASDGVATITLRDTGVGMDEDTLARAFEPYFTTKTRGVEASGGSGLGLALSRDLVESIGGKISAESAPGSGATLTVSLPLDASTGPAPAAPAERQPVSFDGVEILVVEHEGPIRALLEEALESARPIITSNAIEALAHCRRQPFQVALVDATMPGASGGELAARLRELRPATRVVLMSGRPDELDLEELGCDAFLAKPFDLEKLDAVLREVLEIERPR